MRSFFLLLLAVGLIGEAAAQPAASQWRHYGNDPGGMRYAPFDQINRDNVGELEVAWVYHTDEMKLGLPESDFRAAFSATPIYVDGVLYFSTPSGRAIALEADTGRELWMFDPQAGRPLREFNANRGVSYWEGPSLDGSRTERRILYGTVEGRLYALDAGTGRPCPDFGGRGYVDLRALDGRGGPSTDPHWGARITSPPAVYENLVITGWGLPESPGKGFSGDVRAFDIRTGEPVWTFHTVPRPGEAGHETWEGDSWKDRMAANVWSVMSVDPERGLVFLPVGSPAYDFYGGDRKGQNLFGNSLVALKADTGELVWYYQMVHHDIWDYDLPAQPNLITVRRDGRDIPAVAQVTKMGYVFVLDRLTGEPLFPAEERPFPQSTVPGEQTWPTQPIPVKPPPFTRHTMTRAEVSNVTPEANRYCTALFDQIVHNEGLYTPAGLEPTLMFPGYYGGANWSGASYDPRTGLLFVNTNEQAALGSLNPQPPGSPGPYARRGRFEEYAMFLDEEGRPCQEPPWGTLAAIDLHRGEIAWQVPLGIVEELEAIGVRNTGTQNLGGSIATAGGLVFIAGTRDRRFRAFDALSGEILWETELEAAGHATPMTFYSPAQEKQYVIIAAGGGGFIRAPSSGLSDAVVAFRLKD